VRRRKSVFSSSPSAFLQHSPLTPSSLFIINRAVLPLPLLPSPSHSMSIRRSPFIFPSFFLVIRLSHSTNKHIGTPSLSFSRRHFTLALEMQPGVVLS
jgi:hypothetical protein